MTMTQVNTTSQGTFTAIPRPSPTAVAPPQSSLPSLPVQQQQVEQQIVYVAAPQAHQQPQSQPQQSAFDQAAYAAQAQAVHAQTTLQAPHTPLSPFTVQTASSHLGVPLPETFEPSSPITHEVPASAAPAHAGYVQTPELTHPAQLSAMYAAPALYDGTLAMYDGTHAAHAAHAHAQAAHALHHQAAFNAQFDSLVPVAATHFVDDWSGAYGYGFPHTHGYGALPTTTSTVALGGVANLYDGRLVGTAAANPALYAASYGAPYGAYGGYVAPSYVPTAVQGVPTYSALATHSAYTAADLYATVQFDGLNSFAPSYFSSSTLGTTALNTFVPNYFASYSGQFTATHGYY